MSARKTTRRPKAQKPKIIEAVDGYPLTLEQHAQYVREVGSSLATASLEDKRRALKNVIYNSRASVKAHKSFEKMEMWRRATNAAQALGALRDGSLWSSDLTLVALYNGVLCHLSGEFIAIGKDLASMNEEIHKELQS